jgi:hypothetical protein
MEDLTFTYHRELQQELERQGRAADLRRRALIQRRARRRLARAQRSALQARLTLAATSDQHALLPGPRVP